MTAHTVPIPATPATRQPPGARAPSVRRTAPSGRPVTIAPVSGVVARVGLGPFRLESGELLPDLTVAYRHDGRLPGNAPQVLVVHALTGSADAAGDWWTPLVGPGAALDTDRFGVICANLLGGRYGTTGPTALDPRTGAAWGRGFPAVTPRDQARAQWVLLDALGVERLDLVVGGSLGGMVALEVALERPWAVERIVPIAAPAATGPLAIAWNHLQLELVERLGSDGLALARQLAMTTYRSEEDFAERFGRQLEPDGTPAVISYLDHQGRKLVDRFDADSYRVLVEAMDAHDIGRGRGGLREALSTLARSGARLTGVGIEGDILYGPDQVRALVAEAGAAGLAAHYWEIRSAKGHDAFLVEWEQLTAILEQTLSDRA